MVVKRQGFLWVITFGVVTALLAGCATSTERALNTANTASDSDASAALVELVEAYFEGNLKLNPLYATYVGDNRYNDRMANDIGVSHRAAQLELETRYLSEIKKIDRGSLVAQDLLTYDTFVWDRKKAIVGFRYPGHLMPITQFWSRPSFFAQMGSGEGIQPFATVADYDNFLSRMSDFAVWMDQAQANMQAGVERGIVRPRVIMEKVLPQLAAHIVSDPELSVFYRPIENMPDSFSMDDQARLTETYRYAIMNLLVPSYAGLHDFIRDDYLPYAGSDVGLSALPNGGNWYEYLVATSTTTDLTPTEIHELGLREVARITGEMEIIRSRVDFNGPLKAFKEYVRSDPKFYYSREDELLTSYESLKAPVAAAIPTLFEVQAKANFEIRAVESYRAETAAGASYMRATADGSRPGIFYVNTYDLDSRPIFEREALYFHEAVPGHHFQISIQQELEGLPRFRRFGGYTAYVEGWGLYAEGLGEQLGFYTDPYQRFGALSMEILRAARLVVDTGMHAKGWSRERALDYLLENTAMTKTEATAEIERYIAIPGQALAYKIGEAKLLALRETAEAALGNSFDIKEFHTQVLVDGALPLDVLEHKINRWLALRAQ